jgi:hypothetical protein
MKLTYKQILPVAGAVLLALVSVPSSHAACGGISAPLVKHTAWNPAFGGTLLQTAALQEDPESSAPEASIVGFWHVHFYAEGNKGIPNGTEIDAGYSQWHSDGTEIMNSGGRAPDTSNFCLGVWAKTGKLTYKLNHLAASWDPTKGASGELIGPGSITEEILLGPAGEHFAGTFTIVQYNEAGAVIEKVSGIIKGDRIGVNTAPSSIF